MAYYSIFPEKDTTIYSHPDRIHLNTGQDEILELTHEYHTSGGLYYPSRILIKFKDSEIKDVLQNKLPTPTTAYSASIELFAAEHKNVSDTYIISASMVSESWEEGTGRWDATPTSSDGATWIHKTTSSITVPGVDTWDAVSFLGSSTVTGSFFAGGNLNTPNPGNPSGGGNWHNLYWGATEVYDKDNRDIDINVSDAVQAISKTLSIPEIGSDTYPAGIPNNGFVIRKSGRTEQFTASFGELKYFSAETHTIYPPKLTFKWDDSDYHPLIAPGYPSGNLDGHDMYMTLINNKKIFQRASKQRFRIAARKRYPDRTFTTSSNFLDGIGYLPTSSYYSVRDAHTDEIVVPFDNNFTKLSADGKGMYFDLHMDGLQPERYYKILFKLSYIDEIKVIDDDYHFKIVR